MHLQHSFPKIIAILLSLVPNLALAQTYGEGSYGESLYGTGVFTIGSIPVTGSTLLSLGSIGLISISVGLGLWAKEARKSRLSKDV